MAITRTIERRRTANRLLPVSQLPAELLSFIFKLNTEELSLFSWDPSPDFGKFTRNAAQVCHRWRTVALDSGVLWARSIDFNQDNYLWIEELLRRSRRSVLDIGEEYKSIMSPHLSLGFEQISRLRIVNVSVVNGGWDLPPLMEPFRNSAPYLELFSFSTHPWLSMSSSYTTPMLPSPLFNNHAPRLRKLQLRRCSMDFSSRLLHNLTDLALYDLSSDCSPSAVEWTHILGRIPTLERVVLIGAVSGYRAKSLEALQPVTLPKLKSLELTTSLSDCHALLSNLVLPPTCELKIDCQECAPGSDLQNIKEFIQTRLSQQPERVYQIGLQLTLRPNKFWIGSRGGFISGLLQVVPPVSLALEWSPLLDGFREFFPPLSMVFVSGFGRFTSFDINISSILGNIRPFRSQDVLLDFIRSHDSIQKLGIQTDGVIKYLLPLLQSRAPSSFSSSGASASSSSDDTDISSGILLPNLYELTISNINFVTDTMGMLDKLLEFLRFRRDAGVPIKAIQCTWCELAVQDEEQVGALGVKILRL